jgi:aryl-alcohol dehydrogenase-like predicted oxidoreductase
MERRPLGNSGIEISVIGLGTWAMGKRSWGRVDDADSSSAIRKSLDLGINLIDTAPVYGFGHSERVVGLAIQGLRNKAVIATKCGLAWDEASGRIWNDGSKAGVIAQTEGSLKRLGVDWIDLMQVHWPDPIRPVAETMAALVQLREQGKIRAIGLSNYSVEQMRAALECGPVHSLQPPYSLLNREIENEILPFCRQQGIAVLAYSPMAKGILTGKYEKEATFSEDDVRDRDPNFSGERFHRNLEVVAGLREVGAQVGRSPAQVAVNWVIAQPGLTCAICGAKTPVQVSENAGAAGWSLSPEQIDHLNDIVKSAEVG